MAWVDPVTVYFPYASVFDALPRILPSLGWTVRVVDWAGGKVVATYPTTLSDGSQSFVFFIGVTDESHSLVWIDLGWHHDFIRTANARGRAQKILQVLN